jgi:uncharacterized membrane protein YeaQ/YmgE (transglycosylase-associated protein family)
MHLAFDICQGIGIACAVGIRPFLPALVAGGLAAGNVEIHFNGTDYSFLQSAPFLLGMVVGAIALAVIERRQIDSEPLTITLGAIGAALGALFFAGALAHGHHTSWPGLIGGVICALIATLATRPLFVRVRKRLDAEAAAAVPLYAEGTGVLDSGLSIVAPPIGPIGLIALLWLLIAGRRRSDQKYAGLRILR